VSTRLRLALFGSPDFALPTLEALRSRHDLLLVVSQDDKPVGRDRAVTAPPAASRARELGIPLLQPKRLKGNEAFEAALAELDLDVAVTAAYGKILPASLLAIPRHGILNVHASLLPRYRGAAPVQWALIEGERESGVSIMQTETGLDTGPVRHVRRRTIGADEDAGALTAALAQLGAEALLEALDLLAAGALPSVPQDDALASYAPRLGRDDGRVRWEDPASRVLGRHRGVSPRPGSWTLHRGTPLKLHDVVAAPEGAPAGTPPGRVLHVVGEGVLVATGEGGAVLLREVQGAGRGRTDATAWARGARLDEEAYLG
jgi:methionyl-tRNA formyltransferase